MNVKLTQLALSVRVEDPSDGKQDTERIDGCRSALQLDVKLNVRPSLCMHVFSKCNVTDMSAVAPTVTAARSVSDICGLTGIQGESGMTGGFLFTGFMCILLFRSSFGLPAAFSENNI